MMVMETLKKVTIDRIDDFSQQEIFDFVVDHLRRQGETALNLDGDCVYLNGKGQSCAGGCMIPVELYKKEIEGRGMSEVSFWKAIGLDIPESTEKVMLLQNLQFAHDAGVSNWDKQLRNVADQYKLNFEKL
jgi:hypothetical protein